jgi:predicted amidophosphoribosyltransferase
MNPHAPFQGGFPGPVTSYCPFCKSPAVPPRCPRCGRDPTAARRQCPRCLQMTPVGEPPCMHCGARPSNDVAWKLPLLLLLGLVLSIAMAIFAALVR